MGENFYAAVKAGDAGQFASHRNPTIQCEESPARTPCAFFSSSACWDSPPDLEPAERLLPVGL